MPTCCAFNCPYKPGNKKISEKRTLHFDEFYQVYSMLFSEGGLHRQEGLRILQSWFKYRPFLTNAVRNHLQATFYLVQAVHMHQKFIAGESNELDATVDVALALALIRFSALVIEQGPGATASEKAIRLEVPSYLVDIPNTCTHFIHWSNMDDLALAADTCLMYLLRYFWNKNFAFQPLSDLEVDQLAKMDDTINSVITDFHLEEQDPIASNRDEENESSLENVEAEDIYSNEENDEDERNGAPPTKKMRRSTGFENDPAPL